MVALSKRIERDKDNGAMIIQRATTTRICSSAELQGAVAATNNNMSVQRKASSQPTI